MLLLATLPSPQQPATRGPGAPAKACFWSWGHFSCLPSLCTFFGWRLGAGAPLRHPKSVSGAGTEAATCPYYLCPSKLLLGALTRLPKLAGAGAEAATGPPYLLPSDLLLGALLRLPKLVPRAGAIEAACPSCAHPLADVLVQGDPLCHPKSVAGAEADAAFGPPYLRPSNLLLGALVRLPKLDPGAVAIAAACPSCAHPMAGDLVQGAPQRHPKSVAEAGAGAATGPPYLRPNNLLLAGSIRGPGAPAKA